MVSWFKSLLAAIALAVASQADARVDYAVAFTAPEHHLAQVSIAFPQSNGPFLDVKMPVWRTGRYTLLPLANGVRQFTATDASGGPLRWEKVDRSTWRIHLPSPSAVRIRYELYANELGLRSRHIDDSHAFLDASATFMYTDRYRADDVTVSLRVPPGWNSVSGMQSTGPHRFVAPNWDVLVDSPIETGINKAFRFQQAGRDYEVVFWGEGNYDTAQTVADIQKIVAQARTIWGSGYPFQRYVFMIHATDGVGGATEHRNSTVIQIPRYNFQPRPRYLGFLSTASHEFVHTWNVKAYRPKGLVPYNYDQENYSNLLWVAEGSTSYFAEHLLLRAGITAPGDYFEHLSGVISGHLYRPGTTFQSVAEASFDQWIQPSGDRARNASVDIYDQGEVVSWMLDISLLERTGGRISYREVHDALYRRFPADRVGFTDADMLQILRELTGSSWEEWWARNVNAPTAVDFNRLLAPVGLSLGFEHDSPVAWAGWGGEKADNGVRLTSVQRASPAWTAGFTPGDVIVAVAGKPVGADRFDELFADRQPGETVPVTYIRRGQMAQKQLVLSDTRGKAKVLPLERPTARQRALFQRWLLVPHPEA